MTDTLATKQDLQLLEQRLIVKLGAMMAASVGILFVLLKMFAK